jgi:DNA repair ATPase RecN
METLQELRDKVAAGTMAQIWPTNPMKLARDCNARSQAQPKKPLTIFQIQGKLDWLRDEALRLKQYLKPAQECDDEIKDLNKTIAECEKALAWAQSQINFQAESASASETTRKRLDGLKAQVRDYTRRRDTNLRIAAGIKKQIENYATPEEISTWRDQLKAFEAIERLNKEPVSGRFESFA